MDRERAGEILRLFIYPKMEGQDCLQGVPQTYAAALSRGEESGASQPAQGLFTSTDGLLPP